jgi:hypothetical protein
MLRMNLTSWRPVWDRCNIQNLRPSLQGWSQLYFIKFKETSLSQVEICDLTFIIVFKGATTPCLVLAKKRSFSLFFMLVEKSVVVEIYLK